MRRTLGTGSCKKLGNAERTLAILLVIARGVRRGRPPFGFRWGLEALGITNGPASVSVWSKKLEAGNGAAPVRVRVSDRARLQSLIRYLREAGCIAEQASEDTLDVFMPAV